MYCTSEGFRLLDSNEVKVFTPALFSLINNLKHCDNYCTGVLFFDEHQFNQKIAVLSQVSCSLLSDRAEPPKISAAVEGAVRAVFAELFSLLQCEAGADFDNPGHYELRQLGIDCFDAWVRRPGPIDADISRWGYLVQLLRERIVWNEAWTDSRIMDLPPGENKFAKLSLGIPADYFTDVPEDPLDHEVDDMIFRLKKLLVERCAA